MNAAYFAFVNALKCLILPMKFVNSIGNVLKMKHFLQHHDKDEQANGILNGRTANRDSEFKKDIYDPVSAFLHFKLFSKPLT
jgi:hypothetical protein